MAWLEALDKLSHWVYGDPARCPLCFAPVSSGSPIPRGHPFSEHGRNAPVAGDAGIFTGICSECTAQLAQQMAWVCKVCGMPLRPPLELCNDCRLNMYYFDVQRSAGIYTGRLMSAIRRMKYSGERWLSRPLGRLLSQVARQLSHEFSPVGLVVPVPLSRSSLKARGYNQAKDLAAEVSSNIRVPLADILEREEARGSQARLSRRDRWRNLRGTMSVSGGSRLAGVSVLLVDDVATTGATLDEAARALKSAGAAEVLCVTLARTMPYPSTREEG
ncbi:MAG: ComF family protein [Bacillota bacterium]|jgi:ComF family protein|nr:ComF family protein [Candidatus Fermentithermobacillaceae bacterium]